MTPGKPVIYIAAPVTGDPAANAQRAIRWTKWFVNEDPTRVYIAPWVAEVLGFSDEDASADFYQRVLDDDCLVIMRLDGLVGVAGKWSVGMLQERATNRAVGRPTLDMTRFVEPEDVPENFNIQQEWQNVTRIDKFGYVEPY